MEINLFLEAAKRKLRILTVKGYLAVEDCFDLSTRVRTGQEKSDLMSSTINLALSVREQEKAHSDNEYLKDILEDKQEKLSLSNEKLGLLILKEIVLLKKKMADRASKMAELRERIQAKTELLAVKQDAKEKKKKGAQLVSELDDLQAELETLKNS